MTSATPIATVNFYNGTTRIPGMTLDSSLADSVAEGQIVYSSASVPVMSHTVKPCATGPVLW